jgi:small basic protein
LSIQKQNPINILDYTIRKEMYIMGTFLDAQISQNISISGGIAIPLSSTPALFATLDLTTGGAGPNLRVQFTATIAISSLVTVAVPITIEIYRGVGQNVSLYIQQQ